MTDHLPDILLDFQLETVKPSSGHSRRRVTHLVHDPALPPTTPLRLESWESDQRIGRGGQGDVLLQTCTTDGPRRNAVRAVKIFRSGSEDDKRRRVRELETMVRFSHERYSKYFVKMLGWYLTSGRRDLCIAMEYLPTGDLYSYLQGRPPLDDSDARQVITQVLQGLALMHRAGFAHRDIKPQNILIQQLPSSGAGSWWVKLADFGISRRLEGTSTITAIGTYDYMAPELLNGPAKLSHLDLRSSDIWAAGVLTFYIMTKERGFRSWRSSFDPDLLNSRDKNAEQHIALGVGDVRASVSGIEFVAEATTETPDQRLGWDKAVRHRWLGVSGTVNEPGHEADDDDGSSVASWLSSSSSSSGYVPREDEQRGLTTIMVSAIPVTLETRNVTSIPGRAQEAAVHDETPATGAQDEPATSSAEGQAATTEVTLTGRYQDDLYLAAARGDKGRIDRLVQQGASVTYYYDSGLTPLHAVARVSDALDAARALLDHGAEVDRRTDDGHTPLHFAAFRGHAEMMKLLIARGASIHSRTKEGSTPLHQVVLWQHIEAVKVLVENGADIHDRGGMHKSPLAFATERGYNDIVMALTGSR